MSAPVAEPALSVVVLTKDEEANLADALDSLLAQEGVALEAIVVDSASADGTLEIARAYAEREPARVRLVERARDVPIGAARNAGIAAARAPLVAQMSADAMAAPGWALALVHALSRADVVFGRQEHAPARLTPAAIVRGLRYHHFRAAKDAPPETFASNVNTGVRREVFDRLRYVSDGPASALDDVLFAREAKDLGLAIAYEPRMLVRHKDATSFAGEWRKNRREGFGWGLLSPTLGLHLPILAWSVGVLLALAILLLSPSAASALLLALVVYAPSFRRALRGGGAFARSAPAALAAAVLVSPLFDLGFAYQYALGLLRRRRDLTGREPPLGGHAT